MYFTDGSVVQNSIALPAETQLHHRFVQIHKITNQSWAQQKTTVCLPAFALAPGQHENTALYLFFIPFILPITFSPPLMGSVTQPQWRLHQCSCWQIRVNLRMLLPNYWTTAQWDPFDPAPCLTRGHEQEKAVSIRMKREMKRIQTYTMLYQIKSVFVCACLGDICTLYTSEVQGDENHNWVKNFESVSLQKLHATSFEGKNWKVDILSSFL